jgi:8-oxo-dGTP pyrophosphatase MutT (NUDIX family)
MTNNEPSTTNTQTHNPDNLREINRPIASIIILSSDGKLLMGKKDPKKGGVFPNAWHIPGGGIDAGESVEDAARREGFEESGIDLSTATLIPLPFIGHGESPKTLPTGEKVWCNMTFNRFEVRLDKPADEVVLHPTDDLVELRWFDAAELEEVEQIPGGREFFEQAGYIKRHI